MSNWLPLSKILSVCELLYLTYVRPHLEYAVAVWDPHQQGLINELESVQKFALRASAKNWKADYETLIKSCNVPTLAERRSLLKYYYSDLHNSCPDHADSRR